MPKRTPYGNQLYGKLKGFKNFLEVAEKEKLEAMVVKNPTYFYDILPYAYVLEVSDKWISKFENIAMEPPEWYSGVNTFNINSFSSFVDSTISTATTSMSSSPSSSGGVGGGSGGGGGGAW